MTRQQIIIVVTSLIAGAVAVIVAVACGPPWMQVLGILLISGAFGGVLAALRPIRRPVQPGGTPQPPPPPETEDLLSRPLSWAEVARSALGGIGGAIASLSLALFSSKLTLPLGDKDYLGLVCLGTVGGYLGFQLLQLVADVASNAARMAARAAEVAAKREAERVGEVVKKEVKAEVKDETRSDRNLMEMLTAISKALTVLKEGSERELPEAAKQLEGARQQFTGDRSSGIVLGRLYRRMGDYAKGIEVLTTTVDAMRASAERKPIDEADVLFNRSIYYFKLAEEKAKAGQDNAVDEYREKAYVDLAESCRLSPGNKKAAREDRDFEPLRKDKRFLQIADESDNPGPPRQ